jgi:hypothetical protein
LQFKVSHADEPFGVLALRLLLLLPSIGAVLSLIPQIHSVHWPYFNLVIRHDRAAQVESVIGAVFCAAWSYALHLRATVAWVIGWVIGGAGFLAILVSSVRSALSHMPGPDGWIASIIATIAFLAVALYWAKQWKCQEHYFSRRVAKPLRRP